MRENRIARGWSQARAVKELERAGHHMAEVTYRLFESGNRKPGPESSAALADLFGSEVPADDPDDGLAVRLGDLGLEVIENLLGCLGMHGRPAY